MIKQKLDPSLIAEIERLQDENAISKELQVIVRTKDIMTSSQRKQVEQEGLAIASVFGNIFSAAGSCKSVIHTAGFDFVIYIEQAKKLERQ